MNKKSMPPTIIKILNHFFAFIFLITVVFLLCEIAFRIYLIKYTLYDVEMTRYALEIKSNSDNPLIGHVNKPNSACRLMNVDVHINSAGFRDREYPLVKSIEKKRVIFLGDSLTFGWGIEQEDTFKSILEKKLDKMHPTEILNFACGNYNTEQEVNIFFDKGLKYNPDKVVVFYFINDAEVTPLRSQWAFLGHSRFVTFCWSRIQILNAKLDPDKKYANYYGNLYQKNQKGWINAQRAFLQLKEVCLKKNIKLQVVLLPELHSLIDYSFRKEHSLIMNFLNANGIDALDLAPFFAMQKNPKSLWVSDDDSHPNKAAHKLIAEYTFDFIKEGLS